MRVVSFLLVLLIITTVMPYTVQAQQSAGELFIKGLYQEEGARDPQGAIAFYQQILEDYFHDTVLMPRALLRLGICYRKLGQFAQARSYFQYIGSNLSQYPEILAAALRESNLIPVGAPQPHSAGPPPVVSVPPIIGHQTPPDAGAVTSDAGAVTPDRESGATRPAVTPLPEQEQEAPPPVGPEQERPVNTPVAPDKQGPVTPDQQRPVVPPRVTTDQDRLVCPPKDRPVCPPADQDRPVCPPADQDRPVCPPAVTPDQQPPVSPPVIPDHEHPITPPAVSPDQERLTSPPAVGPLAPNQTPGTAPEVQAQASGSGTATASSPTAEREFEQYLNRIKTEMLREGISADKIAQRLAEERECYYGSGQGAQKAQACFMAYLQQLYQRLRRRGLPLSRIQARIRAASKQRPRFTRDYLQYYCQMRRLAKQLRSMGIDQNEIDQALKQQQKAFLQEWLDRAAPPTKLQQAYARLQQRLAVLREKLRAQGVSEAEINKRTEAEIAKFKQQYQENN